MKKNKTTYRLDSTFNNERLYIDVRDDISLLMALYTDKNLGLDPYTMNYLISLRRSLLLTAENVEEETIKIASKALYKLKKKIIKAEKKQAKEVAKNKQTGQASTDTSLGIIEQELDVSEEENETEETEESDEKSQDEEKESPNPEEKVKED